MPVNLTPRRQRWEDQKFKIVLGYKVSSAWDTRETLIKQNLTAKQTTSLESGSLGSVHKGLD